MIGHSDTADLVLEDRFVSRRHALVTVDPAGAVTITDLNSTGGTFVNDERLAGSRVLAPATRCGSPTSWPGSSRPASRATAAAAASRTPATQPMAAPAGARRPRLPVPLGPSSAEGAAGPTGPGSPPDRRRAPNRPTDRGRDRLYGDRHGAQPGAARASLGLTVQLVDKNVGGDQVLASTQTGSDGSYAFTTWCIGPKYLAEHHKTQPDLQVQVLAGGTVLASSEVSYSAPATVSLDVVLPAERGWPAQRVRDADGQPGGGLSGRASARLQEGTAGATSPTWPTRPAGTRAPSRCRAR